MGISDLIRIETTELIAFVVSALIVVFIALVARRGPSAPSSPAKNGENLEVDDAKARERPGTGGSDRTRT